MRIQENGKPAMNNSTKGSSEGTTERSRECLRTEKRQAIPNLNRERIQERINVMNEEWDKIIFSTGETDIMKG